MKKGFTLIEVTVAVLILALLSIFIVPKVGTIIDSNKAKTCASIIKSSEDAAKTYTYMHTDEVDLQVAEVGYYNVTIGTLQDEGLLNKKLENPYEGGYIPTTNIVKITKEGSSYIYTYMGGECK